MAPLLILDASDAPTEDRGSGSSSTSLGPVLEHATLIVLMQADDMEVSSKAHLEQDTGRRAAIRAPSSAIKHPTSS